MIFLYGAPASGKTTLGRRLAAALGVEFVDLDDEVVQIAGRPIPEIFATEGEAAFRDLESRALKAVIEKFVGNETSIPRGGGVLASPDKRDLAHASKALSAIVALGGGTLLRDENREFAERSGAVWCLETPDEEELSRRLGAAPGSRPLGDRARERAAHYASFQNRIAGSYALDGSLVVVGRGLARFVTAGRPVVVDENVDRLWGPVLWTRRSRRVAMDDSDFVDAASRRVNERSEEFDPMAVGRRGETPRLRLEERSLAVVPSGEQHKTLATVSSLWTAFARAGLGRRDTVVAVGGGVTGDLTGFAAATWMRGIDWINVPTTLLAMTDASTGGKTGCDLPEGKNLAGAFHSPKLVVIDTDFLKTLPPPVLAAGRAEMIKHEIIGGLPHADDPRGVPSAAEVFRNLGVKVEIVRKDPFERLGLRSLLNCGHTVAHAVEKISDYGISHGEAVAIGCVKEARIAVERGLAPAGWPEELAVRFAAAGLPTALPDGFTRERLVPIMRGDKKREGSEVVFALPCGWGDVRNVRIDLSKRSGRK